MSERTTLQGKCVTCMQPWNAEAELAVLRQDLETWRDWEKLLAAERANTAEAVRQRDEANQHLLNLLAIIHRDGGHYTTKHGVEESVKEAHQAWAELITRTERLALVAADAEALADALDDMLSYTLSNRGGKYEFVTCRSDADTHALELDAGRAALAAHEALKSK